MTVRAHGSLGRTVACLTAAAALTALSGCGDEGQEEPALPKADGLAGVQKYLQTYTACTGMDTTPEEDENGDSPDLPFEEQAASSLQVGHKDGAVPGKWGITERATCRDEDRHLITFYTVEDMARFQDGYKTYVAEERRQHADYGKQGGALVGQNFAVVPNGDQATNSLGRSDLLTLNCHPKFEAPSGFRSEKAAVDGCVLTDYLGD